jgi:hypothetical protein
LNPFANSGQTAQRQLGAAIGRGESGYAYVMALFMVLTVIVGSQIVLRNMVTVSRSEREAEMIWRGDQYVRAVKMYYRKTGHYPQTPDDLVTGVPEMHFLRSEAMKDPMNNQDGGWRFIYMNGASVIIGSVKYGSLQQMALMDMNGGHMPSAQSANGTNSGSPSEPGTNNSGPTSASPNAPAGFLPSMTGIPAAGAAALSPLGQLANAAVLGPKPTGPVSGPQIGDVLIGVGSTVDKPSVRVYKGGKRYNEWEFIWNPIEEQARAIQQGLGGTGAPGVSGIPGLGLPIAPIGGIAPGTTAPGGATAAPATGANNPGNPNPTNGSNPSGASSNDNPSAPNQ